jgi:hypothetical protein
MYIPSKAETIKTIQWILIFSSGRLHFHHLLQLSMASKVQSHLLIPKKVLAFVSARTCGGSIVYAEEYLVILVGQGQLRCPLECLFCVNGYSGKSRSPPVDTSFLVVGGRGRANTTPGFGKMEHENNNTDSMEMPVVATTTTNQRSLIMMMSEDGSLSDATGDEKTIPFLRYVLLVLGLTDSRSDADARKNAMQDATPT